MKKRILIAGVSGFLGSGLYRRALQEKDLEVFGVDLKKREKNNKFYSCNVCDEKKVKTLLSKLRPDYIFHLIGASLTDSVQLFHANLLSTRSLLNAILQIKNYHPRVIIPGSAAEYGVVKNKDLPIKETQKIQPISVYGFAKHMQTSLGLSYVPKGIDVVIARIFNVSGFGMPANLSLGRFAKEIVSLERKNGKNFLYTKDLSAQRDFVDIKDVGSALLLLAKRGKTGAIYHVCSSRAFKMRNLLKKLLKLSSCKNISIKEEKEDLSKSFDSVGCNQKIKKEIGWTRQVVIEDSLKDVLEYYRSKEI
ncbi:MAG TPA: NAD-dependent epimerase/dehydratase family protein [Candidatus Omnitrophota bacterium]|nr:NAD-dependent epimerase/dehydratase family protein [Candidatus Omnitrophota bacterium]